MTLLRCSEFKLDALIAAGKIRTRTRDGSVNADDVARLQGTRMDALLKGLWPAGPVFW